ncbi:MAG: hypothetical protein HY231_18435 [Acidobacteria bacterium]|nr:hypothetical protein [Acidobacteriota bacterium]
MKNKITEDKLINRFLLGEVADEQKAQVEELFFNDDEFFDSMLAMEDELIDDYVQGALSQRERQLFATHFLNSAERRNRVEFAQALWQTAEQASATPTVKALLLPISCALVINN